MLSTGLITRKELAAAYGCCTIKIRRMLRYAGITHRTMLTPLDFEIFRQKYGAPRTPSKAA